MKASTFINNDITVTDRAALLAAIDANEGEMVIQEDIGLTYVWYDNQTVADNGGTELHVGTGRWSAKFNGSIKAHWFGDTSLEQTFKDASDVGGSSTEVAPGTYTLDGDTIDFTGLEFYSSGVVTINTNTTLKVVSLKNKIEVDDYATPTTGGTVKVCVQDGVVYLTTDGTDACPV